MRNLFGGACCFGSFFVRKGATRKFGFSAAVGSMDKVRKHLVPKISANGFWMELLRTRTKIAL